MASEKKMVHLRSEDGEDFEVLESVIGAASGMIKGLIDEGCATDVVKLPNVKGAVLARVLEYVNKHFDPAAPPVKTTFVAPNADDPLARFDEEFIKVDNDTIFDLLLAANYLNIQTLLDLTCKAVAEQIKGKTPEEIRKHFNIVNDYTKEEEEEVRRENSWAFE